MMSLRLGASRLLLLRVAFERVVVLLEVLPGFRQFLGLRLGIHVAERARFLGSLHVLRLCKRQRGAHQEAAQQNRGGDGVFDLRHETSDPEVCNSLTTRPPPALALFRYDPQPRSPASPGELPRLCRQLLGPINAESLIIRVQTLKRCPS